MGGNNGKKFFNDWYFLEYKSMTWFKLEMNLYLPPSMNSSIFWKAGRGFLLTGEQYEPKRDILFQENKLY